MKVMLASRHLGDAVRSFQGNRLGKVVDFVLDEETATLSFVALASGEEEETGEQLLIVPWPALKPDKEGQGLVLGISKERLKHAPALERSELPSLGERDVRAWVLSYYGFPSRAATPEERRLMGRREKPSTQSAPERDISRLLEEATADISAPDGDDPEIGDAGIPDTSEEDVSGDEWQEAA